MVTNNLQSEIYKFQEYLNSKFDSMDMDIHESIFDKWLEFKQMLMEMHKKPISLYLYKTNDGRYLADMENYIDKSYNIIGAVDPEIDGNYFKELHVCAIKESQKKWCGGMGMEDWLEWLRNTALPNGQYKISDEERFQFDPAEIKIVEFKELIK